MDPVVKDRALQKVRTHYGGVGLAEVFFHIGASGTKTLPESFGFSGVF
jgi:hypothetical protein